MLNHAFFLPQALADVLGPTPTRGVSGPSDRHAADTHEFEFAFVKDANFIGLFEALKTTSNMANSFGTSLVDIVGAPAY